MAVTEVITFPILDEDYSVLRQGVARPPSSESIGFGFPDLPGNDAPLNGGPPFWTATPPVATSLDYTHYEATHARMIGGDHNWSGGDSSDWSIYDMLFVTQGNLTETFAADSIVTEAHLTVTYSLSTANQDQIDCGSFSFFLHPAEEHWFGWEDPRNETGTFYNDNWLTLSGIEYPFEADIFPSGSTVLVGSQATVDVNIPPFLFDYEFSARTLRDTILDGSTCLSAIQPDSASSSELNDLIGLNIYAASLSITYKQITGNLDGGRRIIP